MRDIIRLKIDYKNFAGIDFSNNQGSVQNNRSPYARNVYKNYNDTQGKCIESRPGYKQVATFEKEKINGIYFFNDSNILVHVGTKLYRVQGFGSTKELLFSNMKNRRTSFVMFNNILYILDGINYLKYDGEKITQAFENAYIPITYIRRKPSGGGEKYQAINCLQDKRKNLFLADGTSTDYFLSETNIDSVVEVKVNGTVVKDYTIDTLFGKVHFNSAPPKPDTAGQDNVEIEYSKAIERYKTRISNCTLMKVFDNRIFFAGNPKYPNALFNCQINTPNYIEDIAYYQDGQDSAKINAIEVGNNLLWVVKESNQQNKTLYYHMPYIAGIDKVYPSKAGNIALGCNVEGGICNFNDDIVFLSKFGLEGITGSIDSEQVLSHRSTLVDSKLTNENNYDTIQMQEWNGYLLLLTAGGKIYLADSRQKYPSERSFEYEWYYFDNIGHNTPDKFYQASLIKEYKHNLYFGTEDGTIMKFEGFNDNGEILYAEWNTLADTCGYDNKLKTTNKKGTIAKFKAIPNSKVKIDVKTNNGGLKNIKEYIMQGFDFNGLDFSNFSFVANAEDYTTIRIKEKKFIDIQYRIYTDELDRPFGLFLLSHEVFVGGYVK